MEGYQNLQTLHHSIMSGVQGWQQGRQGRRLGSVLDGFVINMVMLETPLAGIPSPLWFQVKGGQK